MRDLSTRLERLEALGNHTQDDSSREWLASLTDTELMAMLEIREAMDRGSTPQLSASEVAWLQGEAQLSHDDMDALLFKVTGKRLVLSKQQCFPARPPVWECVPA